MDNQEILTKILAKLETLETGQRTLEAGQKSLEAGQAATNERIGRLQDETNQKFSRLQAEMEDNNTKLMHHFNTVIESKVLPEIKLIAEQHGDIISRLKKADEIDGVKNRVSNLERSVEKHTEQITLLQKAQ